MSQPDRNIEHLHPTLQQKIQNVITEAKAQGLNVEFREGLRTPERQNEKQADGKSQLKGNHGLHTKGYAADIVFKDAHGHWTWKASQEDWNKLGEIGKKHGLEWGGDWKSLKDYPHFQLPKHERTDFTKANQPTKTNHPGAGHSHYDPVAKPGPTANAGFIQDIWSKVTNFVVGTAHADSLKHPPTTHGHPEDGHHDHAMSAKNHKPLDHSHHSPVKSDNLLHELGKQLEKSAPGQGDHAKGLGHQASSHSQTQHATSANMSGQPNSVGSGNFLHDLWLKVSGSTQHPVQKAGELSHGYSMSGTNHQEYSSLNKTSTAPAKDGHLLGVTHKGTPIYHVSLPKAPAHHDVHTHASLPHQSPIKHDLHPHHTSSNHSLQDHSAMSKGVHDLSSMSKGLDNHASSGKSSHDHSSLGKGQHDASALKGGHEQFGKGMKLQDMAAGLKHNPSNHDAQGHPAKPAAHHSADHHHGGHHGH